VPRRRRSLNAPALVEIQPFDNRSVDHPLGHLELPGAACRCSVIFIDPENTDRPDGM
jgi:hypothetical protein